VKLVHLFGFIVKKFVTMRVNAKQAKETYQYRNTKRKLYKTKAAIWYNKICGEKRLTPKYISVKTTSILVLLESCLQTCMTYTIAECTVNKLLMMGRQTVQNM